MVDGEVLASPAFARLLLHFALHGDEPQHVRALQRRSGLSMSSLSRELRRLEERGLVERGAEGSRVRYHAVATSTGWKVMRELIREFAHPAEVVEEALAGVEGIECRLRLRLVCARRCARRQRRGRARGG
jgi:DNA-binding MarR family transcriptional regulator